MKDIVRGEFAGRPSGLSEIVPVSALKNFRQVADAAAAKSAARGKDVLLYSPPYEFDEGVFSDLAKSQGALVFSFSDLIAEKGFRRAIMLSKMRLAFSSCRKKGCGFAVCTLANDEAGLRSGRELESFLSVLGMNEHEKKFCESTMDRLACGKAKK